MKHTPISGSNANRTLKCTASALLKLDVRKDQSDYATEGQVAACVAEQEVARRLGQDVEFCEGADTEMLEFAKEYADYVMGAAQLKGANVYVEKFVELYDGLGGTPDCVVDSDEALYIIDYKYGVGVNVSSEENQQLLWYAASHLRDSHKKVILSIYQPRAVDEDTICETEVTPERVLEWKKETIKTIEDIKNHRVEFQMGDHCHFCPVKPFCPEYGQAVARINPHFIVEGKELPDILTLTDIELAKVIDKEKLLKDLLKYVESAKKYAKKRVESGDKIPGWKMVKTRTTRKWNDVLEDDIKEQIEADGINPYKPQQLKPFSYIEKELGKKEFSKKYGDLLVTSDSFGIVPESSPKEEVSFGNEPLEIDLFDLED